MPKRLTISIPELVHKRALEVMDLLGHDDFSGFVAYVLREEYERRRGRLQLRRVPPTAEEVSLAQDIMNQARGDSASPPRSSGSKNKRSNPQPPPA
jgi:hypothetical protein